MVPFLLLGLRLSTRLNFSPTLLTRLAAIFTAYLLVFVVMAIGSLVKDRSYNWGIRQR